MTCNLNNCPKKCASPCCTGLASPKFDPCKAQPMIVYVNRIFDGKIGPGSALVESITTETLADYRTEIQYNSCNGCCLNPTFNPGVGSVFNIECVESKLESFSLTTGPTVANTSVNGMAVAAVTIVNGNPRQYSVTLGAANNVPNALCECEGVGTKSSLVLSSISGFQYIAKHKISGKVTYQGQTADFCMTIRNLTSHQVTPTSTSTLLIPEICIPDVNSQIFLEFQSNITLLNPSISITAAAATATTNNLVLSSSVIVSPEVIAEVILNTRVCVQAMC